MIERTNAADASTGAAAGTIKCVVWDLDGTLWSGTLLEADVPQLRDGMRELVEALDARGILNSIASRNEPAPALAQLRELGLADYFLDPQIGWGAKSEAVRRIADRLDVGLDRILFVDDDPFEREEVHAALPEVRTVDARSAAALLDMFHLRDLPVTDESRSRRLLYVTAHERDRFEESFAGARDEFLAVLDLEMTIAPAGADDLERIAELVERTSQFNSTGRSYAVDELRTLSASRDHKLLIVRLRDRFGSYGRVGAVLVGLGHDEWTVEMLVVSCRVLSRGVGGLVLGWLLRSARDAGVRVLAELVHTPRNRIAFITHRLAGFRDAGERDGRVRLTHDVDTLPECPPYVRLHARWE
jgi:FkbH-like protein